MSVVKILVSLSAACVIAAVACGGRVECDAGVGCAAPATVQDGCFGLVQAACEREQQCGTTTDVNACAASLATNDGCATDTCQNESDTSGTSFNQQAYEDCLSIINTADCNSNAIVNGTTAFGCSPICK